MIISNSKNFTYSYEIDLRLESISIYILLLYHRLRISILVIAKNSAALLKIIITSRLKLFLSIDHVRSLIIHIDLNSLTSQKYNKENLTSSLLRNPTI